MGSGRGGASCLTPGGGGPSRGSLPFSRDRGRLIRISVVPTPRGAPPRPSVQPRRRAHDDRCQPGRRPRRCAGAPQQSLSSGARCGFRPSCRLHRRSSEGQPHARGRETRCRTRAAAVLALSEGLPPSGMISVVVVSSRFAPFRAICRIAAQRVLSNIVSCGCNRNSDDANHT